MEFLIDGKGDAITPSTETSHDAVWSSGFIHICTIGRSLIVCLDPELTLPVTMTGAFYEIAEQNPEHTYIIAGRAGQEAEIFQGFRPALRRIYALVAVAGNVKAYRETLQPDMAILRDGS